MNNEDKITTIFCVCDDFLKKIEEERKKNAIEAPKHRGCGKRKPCLSNAEIITILVWFHFNTFRNFKHYYYFLLTHKRDIFPDLPSYPRFVTLSKRVGIDFLLFLKLGLTGKCTGISFADSTKIPVCHNKRIFNHKVFKDLAKRGMSSMGWYFGFKLHLVCNDRGEILNFALTPANVDDRDPRVWDGLGADLFGKLYADKGYIGRKLFDSLWSRGVHIVTGVKANMKNQLMPLIDKIMLRKRSIIETVNDELKNVAQLVHTRHRSLDGMLLNFLAALSAYCFFEKKPAINAGFYISSGECALF